MSGPINHELAAAIASRVLDFLADQTYQGEPLLHAIVCCDFVSRSRMEQALAKVISNG